jgi:lysyl-tRNA synthetase class II
LLPVEFAVLRASGDFTQMIPKIPRRNLGKKYALNLRQSRSVCSQSPQHIESESERHQLLSSHTYPTFIPSIMVSQFLQQFESVQKGNTEEIEVEMTLLFNLICQVSLAGRVQQRRVHSSVFFLFIKQDTASVQLKIHPKHSEVVKHPFRLCLMEIMIRKHSH